MLVFRVRGSDLIDILLFGLGLLGGDISETAIGRRTLPIAASAIVILSEAADLRFEVLDIRAKSSHVSIHSLAELFKLLVRPFKCILHFSAEGTDLVKQ